MLVYIMNLILTGIFSYAIANEYSKQGIEVAYNKKVKNIGLYVVLIITIWVALYAFRGTTGGDTVVYRPSYKMIYDASISLQERLESFRDPLYQVLSYYCSMFSHGSWIFMCAVTGLIIYIPSLYAIIKKSDDVFIACMMFLMLMTCYYSYNGVRQGISSALAFLAYYVFLREKKYIKYGIIMLIAYGFHAATLLAIPFHIFSLKKLKTVTTIVPLVAFFVLNFFLKNVWENVMGIFNGDDLVTRYSDAFNDVHGSGIIRVIVWLVPVVVSIYLYPKLKEKYKDIDSDIIMVIIGAIIMIYSMTNVDFSQMNFYLECGFIMLVPRIVNVLSEANKKIIKPIIVIVGFAYMTLLMLNGDAGLYPYTPVWESGMY